MEVHDKEEQWWLLSCDGMEYQGVIVRVVPLDLKMSAEDIFRFVEDRLQVEEDIQEAERTC